MALALNNKSKALYLLWVTIHFIIYVTSGNFLTDFESSFYPFSQNIYHSDYDFSEFLIYTILPISFFYFFKLWYLDQKTISVSHSPTKSPNIPASVTIKSASSSVEFSPQQISSQNSFNNISELKYNSSQFIDENSKSVPQGIRGWLLFFFITVVFTSPIFSFIIIMGQFNDPYDRFSYFPKLKTAVITESIVISVILIYGIVVGLFLFVKSKLAKRLVIQYLSVRIILMVSVEVFLILFLEHTLPDYRYKNLGFHVIRVLIAELLFFVIWFIYFKKSKRVANTFIH